MKKFWLLGALLLALALPAGASNFDHTHAAWNDLLQKHISWISNGTASQVDYVGFEADRAKMNSYLATLSAVTFDQFNRWNKEDQLAFLINAYNAFTVELILRNYPGVTSIRDLGSLFKSPWKKEFFRLLGGKHHLDWIEQEMIRGSGRYNEPLIHFAVNCASIGCPALSKEAFVASRLEEQLRDVTRRFLQDRSRNRFDNRNNQLQVSSIFDWYEEDFEQGWRGYTSLEEFFTRNAKWLSEDELIRKRISAGGYEIVFLKYDWSLNNR